MIINENRNNSKNLTQNDTLRWHGVYKQVSVSVAILSNFCVLSRVFKTIFSFVAFITAFIGEKLNTEKWPALASGQKYVTLPQRHIGRKSRNFYTTPVFSAPSEFHEDLWYSCIQLELLDYSVVKKLWHYAKSFR